MCIRDSNSTSQRAWEATLLGLKKRKLLYSRSGTPSVPVSYTHLDVYKRQVLHLHDFAVLQTSHGRQIGGSGAGNVAVRRVLAENVNGLAGQFNGALFSRGGLIQSR